MQKDSAFLWRPFVQWKTKETFCSTKFYQFYRNKVGRFFFFFFYLFLYLFQKPKHLFKENIQSNRLSSHRVKICLQKIRSLRCCFTQNWVFLHTLFLENEVQIDWNNYGAMLFMSKQVSLPKICLILQKMKIGQNSMYALFARSPSIKNNLIFTHC